MTETDVAEPARAAKSRRWMLPLLLAAGAAVLAIVAIAVLRVLFTDPAPALGPTAVADLRPGACLAEPAVDLATYTVVDCDAPHPQQVVAEVELTADAVDVYSSYTSITSYVELICDRMIEYDLFVREGARREGYDLVALAVPDRRQWETGTDRALCAIVADDGTEFTESLYRRMP